MNNDAPFEVTGTRTAYENPWIKIREDSIKRSNGQSGIYGYMEVGESVAVVAVDRDDKICIVESYRHPFGEWYWGLPGGGGDGENLLLASQRELEEETGVVANDLIFLGRARVYNGLSTEWQSNVLARNVSYEDFVQREDEVRNRKFVSLKELDEMILNGKFQDNQSITALYMYKLWLEGQLV